MTLQSDVISDTVIPAQEPVAAPIQATPTAPAQEPASREIVSLLAKNGYDISDDYTDADYFKDLEGLQSSADEFERIRPDLEEFSNVKDDFLQWRASRSQTPVSATPVATASPAASTPVAQPQRPEPEEDIGGFNPPAVDPAAQRMVAQAVRDGAVKQNPATGLYETESAVYRNAVDQVNAVENYKLNFYADFAKDPASIITKAARPVLSKYDSEIESLKQQIQQFQQAAREEAAEQILHQQFTRMVEIGADGQPVVENGQYRPTPFYRAYSAALQQISGYVSDPVERTQKALEIASQLTPQQVAPPAESATTPRDRQWRFLRRVQGQAPDKVTDLVPETRPGNPAVAPASTPMARYDELIKEHLANSR